MRYQPPLASVNGPLFVLQLSNPRRKLFVAQLLGVPMLLRNADISCAE